LVRLRGRQYRKPRIGKRIEVVMRRYLLSMALAGFIALMASPAAGGAVPDKDDRVDPAPLAVQRVAEPSIQLRDEALMVLVGTALIGLAAAVRRAA
jgi:hypothetical protein